MYPLLALGAVASVVIGVMLYVARTLKNEVLEPTRKSPPFDVKVVGVEAGQVTLEPTAESRNARWKQEGRWGLRWNGGHAQVHQIVRSSSDQVVREFERFVGCPEPGASARLDWAAFPDDPEIAFDLRFQPVRYQAPLGWFHAAFLPGRQETWVLFVHGKRGAVSRMPPHAYPLLPTAARLGFPCLDVTYRNDHGAPRSPDGFHRYGLTEWEDLEAAVGYAVEAGAGSVILVGYSMGGAIVASFLYRSALKRHIRGAILDAPVLDLNAVIDSGVHRRGVPHALIRPGRWLAGVRFGIDWRALDYLEDADKLAIPVLLFHGTADPVVPIETSQRLAAMRPDIVTYVPVPCAGHGQAWNIDPDRYDEAVSAFLDRLSGPLQYRSGGREPGSGETRAQTAAD